MTKYAGVRQNVFISVERCFTYIEKNTKFVETSIILFRIRTCWLVKPDGGGFAWLSEKKIHPCRRQDGKMGGFLFSILFQSFDKVIVYFQVGDSALEIAGLLQRKDQRAQIVHGVFSSIEIKFLHIHLFNQLSIYIQRS